MSSPQSYPQEFKKKVVLDSIQNPESLELILKKYEKQKVTIENINEWKKEYDDKIKGAIGAVYIESTDDDKGINYTKLIKALADVFFDTNQADAEKWANSFLPKLSMLFLDDEQYISSFETSSYVNDSLSKSTNEELIVDYESLHYVRYMKLYNPVSEYKRAFNIDGRRKTKEPIDTINVRQEIDKPFHLRYYIPKEIITQKYNSQYSKRNRIVIMINGMNEDERFDTYDVIGEFFANNGTTAVLLPTPLHLNRRVDSNLTITKKDKRRRIKPTDLAERDPLLFYYSFLQTYDELNELINKINPQKADKSYLEKWNDSEKHVIDKAFYKNHFWKSEKKPAETDVILLGYSLGGLKSFSYFLNMPQGRLKCCITLNSSPNLLKASTYALGLGSEWKRMLRACTRAVSGFKGINNWECDQSQTEKLEKDENSIDGVLAFRQIFQGVYFNESRNKIAEILENENSDIINRFLAINSGADQIVDSGNWRDLVPEEKYIHNIIVADVDHILTADQNWHDVLPRIQNDILLFINTCHDKHYKKQNLSDKLYTNILCVLDSFKAAISGFEKFGLEHKRSFSQEDIEILMTEIETAEIEKRYAKIRNEAPIIGTEIEEEKESSDAEKKQLPSQKKVEEFLHIYFCTKGYYINFSEIYNKILRDHKKGKFKEFDKRISI